MRYRCWDCERPCRKYYEFLFSLDSSDEYYPENRNGDCSLYKRVWWVFWRPNNVGEHDVSNHPGAGNYYQAFCAKCGWLGCSCQLKEARGLEDSEIYCPKCNNWDIESIKEPTP